PSTLSFLICFLFLAVFFFFLCCTVRGYQYLCQVAALGNFEPYVVSSVMKTGSSRLPGLCRRLKRRRVTVLCVSECVCVCVCVSVCECVCVWVCVSVCVWVWC
uniref:Uncharacterized protein n=1 Tax=Dicentrarchus labrax TaxID=13489 RepID=A0A8P4GU23_DICLA